MKTRVYNRPDLLKDQRSGAVIKTSSAMHEAKRQQTLEKTVSRQQAEIDSLHDKIDRILDALGDNNGSD